MLSKKARFKALRDLGLAVEDARKLGLNDGKIAVELQRANVPEPGMIMNNMFMPSFPSTEVLSRALIEEKNKVSQAIPFGEIAKIYAEQISKPLISPEVLNTADNTLTGQQTTASEVLRQEEINKVLTGRP